jgi:predicted small metal-binding protein
MLTNMFETGLDCDYVIEAETREEILKDDAERDMKQQHRMKVEEHNLTIFLLISYAKLLENYKINKLRQYQFHVNII